ncbi:MAG TPA: hypothetical protein VJZ71_10255 [Phycisphaerae bacterium]|nr:hypothetical protein [Phycisphaerae bacterium]
MFRKNIGLALLTASALLFLGAGARAGDDPEPACNDADVEGLETTIQCNGANWTLAGTYDVEIEDPASDSQFDLVLTLRDCNCIPSDKCGQLATFTIPLDCPSPLDADDNDEIEFEGSFSQCVSGDLVINCKRLRVLAEVVERCERTILDKEEDKVAVLKPGTCSEPQVACAEPCDPCATSTAVALVSETSPCDPCAYTRAVR